MKTHGIVPYDKTLSDEEMQHALELVDKVEQSKDYFDIMTAAREFDNYMKGLRTAQALTELAAFREAAGK